MLWWCLAVQDILYKSTQSVDTVLESLRDLQLQRLAYGWQSWWILSRLDLRLDTF